MQTHHTPKKFARDNPFEGLAAKLPAGQRTQMGLLRTLMHSPRVSTWDMEENPWLTDLLKELHELGLIQATPEAFPWHCYRPTSTGKAKVVSWLQGEKQ